MGNKTCGECKYFVTSEYLDVCVVNCETRRADRVCDLCDEFKPRVATNGDVIRQGGDAALAHFKSEHKCDVCAYAAPIDTAPACLRPEDKTCFDGMLAWLNAPAESEVNK